MQNINYQKYNPVISISFKGKVLVGMVRLYYRICKWLGKDKWDSIIPNHHEDPLTMSLAEKRFLGHKYYFRAMIQPEACSGIDTYFAKQDLNFIPPVDFVPLKKITINAGGDLMPYSCIRPEICTGLWKHIGNFFFDADIVFANLETPVDVSKPASTVPEVMLHHMYFNGDEAMFKIFNGNNSFKGYDVLSIANNHSLDMGAMGLTGTMQLLQQKGIKYCGAAMSENELNDFPVVERDGTRIVFLSATFSFNKERLGEDEQWLCNHVSLNHPDPDLSLLIRQAAIARKKGADIIVAALHAGCAYQAYPGRQVMNNYHAICDKAGIDIIIGSHPHNAQAMEVYRSAVTGKEHFIAYSLGDFIAYDIFKWCHLPLMLKIEISKGMLNGKSFTCITGLKLKAGYMHATSKNGEITSLELLDYKDVRIDPSKYFTSEKDIRKFDEISYFFERFVLSGHQQHLLS